MLQHLWLFYGILQKGGVKEGCSGVGGVTKLGIFIAAAAVGTATVFVSPVECQDYSHVNSPPILIVPDRNWRILETERIGQIISRIRADDSENDVLIFGLEPAHKGTVNPFCIDPVVGIVYLNQSLAGRGGENFFLYVTVTDGQLTAKNEVYVNILPEREKAVRRPRPPPFTPNIEHNLFHFLPSFDRLPGVQSIRNRQPNRRPSNTFPDGFNNIFTPPILNFSSNRQTAVSAKNSFDEKSYPQHNFDFNKTSGTSLIMLTPINRHVTILSSSTNYTNSSALDDSGNIGYNQYAKHGDNILHEKNMTTIFYGFGSRMVPLLLTACGIFLAGALIIGFRYRKYLCSFQKKLEKKSKDDIVKKEGQSNLSHNNLTENIRHSIVMQHWNGPIAFNNRYVPWERDQQSQQQLVFQQQEITQHPIAISELSTSLTNPGLRCNHSDPLVGIVGRPPSQNRNAVGDILTQQEDDNAWEFPRHRLKFFNILGEGAFGQVWRCEATEIDGNEGVTTVAVKTLKENATEVEKKDLLSELKVMKSLEPHVNVVRFLGCCTKKDPIFVIIEYVDRGKLQTYLRRSRAERHYGNTNMKSNVLTSGDLTSFMYQVAKGMDYLSSRGIIHRDLAARNILIAKDHTCKIADFGFARDIITSQVYERKSDGKLPIRWMAIESLYDNIFSIKSDIWSFGILMWEIVTLGSTPYPGMSASDVMRKVRDGYRLEKPEHCRRELYNIMYYCWSQNTNERPSFGDLVKMLDKLLRTEMDYIELQRFPDHNYHNILCLSGEKL